MCPVLILTREHMYSIICFSVVSLLVMNQNSSVQDTYGDLWGQEKKPSLVRREVVSGIMAIATDIL